MVNNACSYCRTQSVVMALPWPSIGHLGSRLTQGFGVTQILQFWAVSVPLFKGCEVGLLVVLSSILGITVCPSLNKYEVNTIYSHL